MDERNNHHQDLIDGWAGVLEAACSKLFIEFITPNVTEKIKEIVNLKAENRK